ncbi:MAG: radical SAM protein [bacterium]
MTDAADFPARLHVETTSACNQRCRFCTHPTMERTKRHMPVDLFEKIALEAGSHRARLWLHFLGEPLLHPRIFEMVAFAKRAGAPEVGFSTNAVLLTRERVAELFDSGLDRLEISIDAATAEGYLALRGTDDFAVVTTHVRALLREKRARGVARPTITLAFLDAGHDTAERRRFLAEWAPLLDEPDFLMAIPAISFGGAIPAALPERVREPCHWLFRAALVLSNGDVVTCATDYRGERVLGNVAREKLADIWRGETYRELRARHAIGAYAGVTLCDTCRDWIHSDGRGYVNFSRDERSPRTRPTE